MAVDSATATSPNGTNGTNGDMAPRQTNATAAATGDGMTTMTGQSLSADEIALYDRQIRLWGAQAQERIRSAHILLVSLRALGTEIAKNLVLAGISSLTIIDDSTVTEEDLGAQYFLRDGDVGKPRAQSAIPRIQELNPRVTVKTDGGLNDLLMQNESYYAPFDIAIACDHDFMTLSMINTAARFASRPFYAAGIHGFYGYIFADLFGHEFVVEREKSNRATAITAETMTRSVVSVTTKKESKDGGGEKTIEIVKKQEIYCPFILANTSPLPPDVLSSRRRLKAVGPLLPCLRALFDFQRSYLHFPIISNPQHLRDFTTLATDKVRELQLPPETLRADFLRSFIQNIGAEMVPTAAFVGGRLSEDVINVLGKREQPIQNFALFDGDGLEGKIYSLYSPPPEATLPMGMDIAMGMDGAVDPMNGGLGMSMGMMPMGGELDMGVGGMGNMGMIDGGMMDMNAMVGMGNGMANGVMGGVPDVGAIGPGNGVGSGAAEAAAEVPAADSAVDSGTEVSVQDPPRSVPADEAEASGS